ncbi:MAG TPA: dicarboxylate/amino acid:cation symporter [Thermoanaerobaculia bacterium]
MSRLRSVPLHARILLGLVSGAMLGGLCRIMMAPEPLQWFTRQIAEPVGHLYLRLLILLVVPLVFSSLIAGVAGMGDLRRLGRVGLRSLAYTIVVSAISVLIGLGLANLVRPGERLDRDAAARLKSEHAQDAASRIEAVADTRNETPLMKTIRTLIPANPFAVMAKDPPDMMGVMFFALFLGVALTGIPAARSEPVVGFFEGLFAATTRCVEIVMQFAPIAVFCLLFSMTTKFGFSLLELLGWYVATVIAGLAIHMFGVYSLSVSLLSRIAPTDFFRRIRTVMATAFSTSSSNATLPTALHVAETRLGVPRQVSSFVLTIGATANQNGTALFEGVTVLFLAQLAGVELTIAQQLAVLYLAILGGIGTAGVPSGSIPFVIAVLGTIGVDPALIAIVLGVDRLLDMCRTVVNVVGDLTLATWIARTERVEGTSVDADLLHSDRPVME